MVEVLNIDKMLPDAKEVILGGKTYKVSGSLTVGMTLGLFKHYGKFQENPNDPDTVKGLIESAINIFEIDNPDLDKEEFKNKLPIALIGKLIKFLAKTATEEQEDPTGKKEELEPVQMG